MREFDTTNTVAVLKTLEEGTIFSGVFLVKSAQSPKTKAGNPYRSLSLGDETGAFNCNIFDSNRCFKQAQEIEEGAIVYVEGVADMYRENFSPKIDDIREIAEEEVPSEVMERLVAVSPEDFDKLCAELDEHIAAIKYEPLRKTVRDIIDALGETFKNSTAALKMHQAYRHGLLEHSCHLARAARALLPHYKDVNPDLAIAGALLHDIGKTLEYTQTRAPSKTRAGILQGHLILGYRIFRGRAMKNKLDDDLRERLEHIILSHHENPEWGAAVRPATPEAIFVFLLDYIDSRMAMVSEAIRNAAPDKEFSEEIFGLEKRRILLTPPVFPEDSDKSA